MDREASAALKERARRAYERGRVRYAVWAALPTAIVALVGGLMGEPAGLAALTGALLYGVAVFCYYRGQHVAKGVLPGIAAGAIPFVAVHAARASEHYCSSSECTSYCLPACVVGGIAAGLLIAYFARASRPARVSWVSAGVVASLTGALGCVCIGVGGILALLGGLLLGAAPLALRPMLGRS
jgi:hypothetical protein